MSGFGRADCYASVFHLACARPPSCQGWARFRSSDEKECRDPLDLQIRRFPGWRFAHRISERRCLRACVFACGVRARCAPEILPDEHGGLARATRTPLLINGRGPAHGPAAPLLQHRRWGLLGLARPFLRANAARTASVCGWPLAARNKKTPASRSCRGFPLHHGRSREARARSFCVNFPQTFVASMHLRSIPRITLRKVLTSARLPHLFAVAARGYVAIIESQATAPAMTPRSTSWRPD